MVTLSSILGCRFFFFCEEVAPKVTPFGIEVVTKLCQVLIQGGASGIHFYTLNQLELTRVIVQQLALLPTNREQISYEQVAIQTVLF